ncbi:MAG: ATP-binding protein, partial [Desulfobacteraceae bacterium]
MKAFKDFSVKMKLVIIIVGVSFGIVFTGFLILFINYTSVLKNDLKSNAIINARLVGQYCIVPLTFEYGQEAQDVLSKLTAFPDIMNACVYDRDNHVFATFKRDKTIQASWPAQVPKSETAFFKEDRLHVFHPILYQDKRYGAIYLQVATESLKGQILHRLLFMLAVTSALLVLSYILADKLHKPITGPIYNLADVAHTIAEKKDYSIRVEAKGKDEIGTLYNRFNYLCEQIEGREKERDSAEKQIMKLNEDLELRIKKRTSDLEKLNKELLIAKEEAEDANRTKSEFLANMSHEIRTPLNAITGLMYLALQSNPSPQVHGYLIKIENAAHSLLRIINDILDFSKIEAEKLTIESEEFFLEDVLEEVSNIVSIQADEKQLEFIITIDDDVPQGLVGDPLRLEQILVNLAGNAVKFTEKGEVVIAIGVTEKKWNKAALSFSVKDTGIGLDDKHQKRLFKAFSQADTSTTRKFGGTGLGLVICKRLVNMMGGDITMESKLGIGSTFSFTAIFGRHNRKQKVSLLEENFKEMRALVVDDNQTARKNIRYILESFKFDVAEANTGIKALQVIRSSEKEGKSFDLVIMDWKMPLMDGLETARHIRNDLKLINIPVILMVTAYGREEVL